MTDNNPLADNNIKHFGKQVSCYRYPTGVESEPILCQSCCSDRVCLECGNDHSFRDAITFIDLLPEIFKENRNTANLQEFVN